MNGAMADNPAGHGEAWESIRINDRLLELSGGSWLHPHSSAGAGNTG